MPLQKIPLEAIQKIRQHIQQALTLPESENCPKPLTGEGDQDIPEPDSLGDLGSLFHFGGIPDDTTHAPNDQGKWFISTIDPGAALIKLPGLKLKPELRLVSFLYRVPGDGMGVTWAMPEELSTTAQLEQALTDVCDRAHPPTPIGSLGDVMEGIEGDRSPASFLVASILQRELKELGNVGKSCNWGHHRLVAALPTQVNWQWRTEAPQPKDFSPKVQVGENGKVAIEFFSCRVVAPIALFQHIDQYPPGSYKANRVDRPLAIARKG